MQSLWVVFRADYELGITGTVGEFHAVSQADAVEEAVQKHGARDWWEYWGVPSEWFRAECLEMLLENALH